MTGFKFCKTILLLLPPYYMSVPTAMWYDISGVGTVAHANAVWYGSRVQFVLKKRNFFV
jgi:hypothetical protein